MSADRNRNRAGLGIEQEGAREFVVGIGFGDRKATMARETTKSPGSFRPVGNSPWYSSNGRAVLFHACGGGRKP